ncbi:MAG: hypothetical protein IKA33_05645 [Candidatus Methanomethylophilaceae archaeon]|nr:hypothetical protein [Candidatus Methanomethylophilaceae archaeon]
MKFTDFLNGSERPSEADLQAEGNHRDVKYPLPSRARQLRTVYLAQMKLFMKGYVPLTLLAMIAVIPVIIYSGALDNLVIDSTREAIGDTGETYVAICLGAMSAMMALIASMVCGSMLPAEFKHRTAYINFPIPQSRGVFYIGKFLAGFTLIITTILLAFGESILMASFAGYPSISTVAVAQALLVSITGGFAFGAIAYGLSAFMNSGSTMLPFSILFIIVPTLCIVVFNAIGYMGLIGYVPVFSGDLALAALGSDKTLSISVLMSTITMDMSASPVIASLINVLCGVLFLLLGLSKTRRREI